MLRGAGRRIATLSWRPTPTASVFCSRNPVHGPGETSTADDSTPIHAPSTQFAFQSALLGAHEDMGLTGLPATVAAVKNPTSKIVYDEHNHERLPPGDPAKRAFAYMVLTGGRFVYASLLRLLILKFVLSMSATLLAKMYLL